MTELVRKDSVEELIGHRMRAMDLYLQGFRAMVAAVAAHRRACVGLTSVSGLHWEALRFVHMETRQRDEDSFVSKQRASVDGDMWRAFLVNTRLGSLMDKIERDAFEKGLQNPPEITIDTVMATLQRLAGDAETIFRRGLVDAFRSLSREHASNDGFTVGERMVIKRVVTVTRVNGDALWVRSSEWGAQVLRDVDRCLHILSGRPAPKHMQGISQAVYEAIGRKEWEASTDLVRVRWHKNGNGHLWVLDPKLREDVNREIAAYFGAAVGHQPPRASTRSNANADR